MSRLERFLDPPRLRTLETDGERRATWLELFVDLVFVAAIAEVASTLSADPTAAGFGRFLALFLPIAWAWSGFAFYATRFDTDDLVYRLLTLLGMFTVAALASTVPDALHGGQNAFAVAYVCVRLVLLALYARVYRDLPGAKQSPGGCSSSSGPQPASGWSRSSCRRRGNTSSGAPRSCSSTSGRSGSGGCSAPCPSIRATCPSGSACSS